jgi:hypothetical protein
VAKNASRALTAAEKTARSALKKATGPKRRKTARKNTGPGLVKRLKSAISHLPVVGSMVDNKN